MKKTGILLLIAAFLVSPFGLPLPAELLVEGLDGLNCAINSLRFG